ncbi:vWA domain-containing protein [Methylotuvimicrobium sp. KM2]|uniref:vWA domain-containing protein n=1 Tax=Methylotuvimicrobium sp. KM2 TaxID=3133976 RepID=UPI003100F695
MDLALSHPWVLLFSPLALLPFFGKHLTALRYSSLSVLPFDPLSFLLFTLLKLIGAGVILLLLIALAGPYLKEQTVQRLGQGAEIVILLDRSASMNENFAGRYFGGAAKESKIAIARDLLRDFITRRKDDFFGMISFSTAPIHVMPLTQNKTAILAAIDATRSRGRGVTNIAPGLAMALDYFQERPLTGSRVILLVSDGAARIDPETQSTLAQLFHQYKVMLYWVYLRDDRSLPLDSKPANANETTSPEYFLHQFFQSIGIPYKAFEAQNPEALQNVIDEIGRLENKPIQYTEKIARQSLAEYCYLIAITGILLLLIARYFELKSEQHLSESKEWLGRK